MTIAARMGAGEGMVRTLAFVILLTGCCPQSVRPEVVEIARIVVQPVPADLLTPLPVAVGPLRDCPVVASERKAALAKCNAQLDAIRGMQEKGRRE